MLSIVIVVLLRIGSFDGVESAMIWSVSTAFGVRGQLPLSHKEYAGERSHCCTEESRVLRRSLGRLDGTIVTIVLKGPCDLRGKTAAGMMEY